MRERVGGSDGVERVVVGWGLTVETVSLLYLAGHRRTSEPRSSRPPSSVEPSLRNAKQR